MPVTLAGRRLALVLNSLEMGGAERQALLLAKGLRDNFDARVMVLAPPPPGGFSTALDEAGILWQPFKPAWGWRALPDMVRQAWRLRREQFWALLPMTAIPNLACAAIWRWTHAQHCVWNQRDEGVALTPNAAARWAVRQANRIVANSPSAVEFLHQALDIAPTTVRLIPNGVQLEPPRHSRHEWRHRLGGLSESTVLVGMPANFTRFKDHATLLRAWCIIGQHHPTARLILAGRHDEMFTASRRLAEELGIADQVVWPGVVDDMTGWLSALDLVAFSSHSEGLPNGVLEPMAAGLACVATDLAGVRFAMGEQNREWLVPPQSPTMFAKRLLTLMAAPELRTEIGHRNRQRILDCFSPTQMVRAMAEELMDKPAL